MTDHIKAIKDALEAVSPLIEGRACGLLNSPGGLKELQKKHEAFRAACNPTAIRALLAELEEAKRNTDRYRWVRMPHNYFKPEEWGCYGEDLDAGIDEEIAAAAIKETTK